MSAEPDIPVGTPVPRIDSFEVVDPEDTVLTDEEKSWPVVPVRARIDSFEVIEPAATAVGEEYVIRVRLPSATPREDVAALFQRLRAVVEETRSASGGRIPAQIDAPAT